MHNLTLPLEITFSLHLAAAADISGYGGPHQDDELRSNWCPAVLSIGTFGTVKGRRGDLQKMQEELTLLMSAKAMAAAAADGEEDKSQNLTPKRSPNRGMVKHRSFRKFMSIAFSSFLPRPIFRGSTHEPKPTEVLLPNVFPNIFLQPHIMCSKYSSYVHAWISSWQVPWPSPYDDMPSDNWAMSEATIKSYRTAHLPSISPDIVLEI